MSLRVWLPLNGDLHNLGLDGVLNFITSGTITDTNGKIGLCKSFSSASAIAPYSFTLGAEASICCWVNYNALPGTSSNDWLIHVASTSNYENAVLGLSTYHRDYLTVIAGGKYDYTYLHGFVINTWYHICFVWTTTEGKLYINGTLVKTYSNLSGGTKKTGNKISLASNVVNSSTKLNGKLNDVRIYDHALSELEIKEIARAKILHYPLNHNGYGMPNLLKLGNILQTGNSLTAHILYWYFDFSGNLPTGIYTLSFDAKTSNGTDNAYVSYANGSSTIVRISDLMAIPSTWKHYTFTFTNAASNCNDIFFTSYKSYGGSTSPNKNNTGYLYVRNVKLENGDKATSFALAASEDTTITEYDISGYCNNGTKVGTFTYSTDTPKYGLSTYINASSTANRIESINDIVLPTNGITASLWVKTSSKATNLVLLATSQIEIGLLNSLCYVKTSSAAGFTTTNFINNEWNHIIAIRINDTYKLYINGVEEILSGASNYYLHNKNTLYLFNRSYNNSYAANANLSDVRIYATALSAQDILSLYHNSALVDELGIIHGAIH